MLGKVLGVFGIGLLGQAYFSEMAKTKGGEITEKENKEEAQTALELIKDLTFKYQNNQMTKGQVWRKLLRECSSESWADYLFNMVMENEVGYEKKT